MPPRPQAPTRPLALLLALPLVAGCMPPPDERPLTAAEKRRIAAEYLDGQELRSEQRIDRTAGRCMMSTGVARMDARRTRQRTPDGMNSLACQIRSVDVQP